MAEDERGLFKWLTKVVRLSPQNCSSSLRLTSEKDKFGFCFISGVPPTPEATEELSRRIGFIRETQCVCTNGILEQKAC